MKKVTSFSKEGYRTDLDPLTIKRMLPNRYADKVGPFVFLDYIVPATIETITRVVAEGPFVMNSLGQIANAYKDF